MQRRPPSATRTDTPFPVPPLFRSAPTRAILCAGAGHCASAHVTLTDGAFIGNGGDAGERLVAAWDRVVDREGEVVPAFGFTQAERELASAGFDAPTMAVAR